MRSRKQLAALATVLSVLLMSGAATAQVLQVAPSPVLTEGTLAKISYKDPRQAGQTITVVVSSGGINPEEVSIQITLDAAGKGAASFPVPDWGSATFEAPGAAPVALPIVPSSRRAGLALE